MMQNIERLSYSEILVKQAIEQGYDTIELIKDYFENLDTTISTKNLYRIVCNLQAIGIIYTHRDRKDNRVSHYNIAAGEQ